MEAYQCKCGFRFGKNELIPGQKVRCPDCGNKLSVPDEEKKGTKVAVREKRRERTDAAQPSAQAKVFDSASQASSISRTVFNDLPEIETVSDRPPRVGPEGQLRTGQLLLDRYQITEMIGRGGMSEVYSAKDKVRRERIALKVLLPELRNDPRACERFLREGRMASSFSHPHIARVFDLQQTPTFPFMTMELLQGSTLRQDFERRDHQGRKFSPQEANGLLRQMTAALTTVHQRAIHRDVKPDNVWVTPQGKFKLMDFGIACELNQDASVPALGVSGSAYYMAPEQLHGRGPIDARADQYAVGVMLYEALTGTVPQGASAPPHELDRAIPKALSQAVMKALSPNPEMRHESMEAFCEAAGEESPATGFTLSHLLIGAILVPVLVFAAAVGYLELSKRRNAPAAVVEGEPVEERYENKRIQLKGQTISGVREGKWLAYHQDGKRWVEGNFLNGEPDGVWTYWDSKGEVVGTRDDGKKTGHWQETSADGHILANGDYKAGHREGTWSFYDVQSGAPELLLSMQFDNGIVRKFTSWNSDRTTFVFDYDRVRHVAACVSILYPDGKTELNSSHAAWSSLRAKLPFKKDLGDLIHRFDWKPVLGPFDPEALAESEEVQPSDEQQAKPKLKTNSKEEASFDFLAWYPGLALPGQSEVEETLKEVQSKSAVAKAPAAVTPMETEPTQVRAKPLAAPPSESPKGKTDPADRARRKKELEKELAGLQTERERLEMERDDVGGSQQKLVADKGAEVDACAKKIMTNSLSIAAKDKQIALLKDKIPETERLIKKQLGGKTPEAYGAARDKEIARLEKAIKERLLEVKDGSKVKWVPITTPTVITEVQNAIKAERKLKADLQELNDKLISLPEQIAAHEKKQEELRADNLLLEQQLATARVAMEKAQKESDEGSVAKKLADLKAKIQKVEDQSKEAQAKLDGLSEE